MASSSYFTERSGPTPDLLSPSTTTTASAPRSSALSSRITSVLSASYADLDLRDALDTLDTRNFENTQESRRNLRLDLQQEVIKSNGEIIQDFGQVAEQLKRIGSVIDSLNKCCSDMRVHISASQKETIPVLEDANSILSQKSRVESKQQILKAFQSHFIVSEDEIAVLTSSSEPVNDSFFRILAKVKKIHKDSEVLLGTENERLGLEILDQSSKQLNSAFQKLYRWIQKDFKTLDLENPQISSSIRQSLRVLAERPALFQSCMDFFAEAREHTLSDSFHAALTGSTAGLAAAPDAKPIEFQAHDPLRYIGDMLAWSHSATVSEREALEILFVGEGDELAKGIKAGIDSDPWSTHDAQGKEETYDGRKALNELVSRDIAGVARLLRQRTEQVISSHEDATLAYKIANLIAFYRNTFSKLIGPDAAILEVLGGLEKSAEGQFKANMRDHVISIHADRATAPPDLSPPDFLEEALVTLKALMKSYDTSLAAINSGDDGFAPVLVEALDPFMKACGTIFTKMAPPPADIFAFNCLLAVREVLKPFSFTASRLPSLEERMGEHAEKLMEYQFTYLVESSGIEPIIGALSSLSNSSEPEDFTRISSLPLFQQDSLIAISQQLDDFLPSALMDAMDNLKLLRSRKSVRDITERAAEKFCEVFEMVEQRLIAVDELLEEEESGSEDGAVEQKMRLRDCFPRTSGEIRVLLS
ncbi:oligomeric Golgi complex subunit 6 [Venturia nashicola]|uniref:Conserved oligomeric Golgi complex subunit 6 n=1 Tax=Venturia nashicola TaxID=86259 RepID=A0A4Z1P0H2_9PEZI|nr:oligomeric Golgi complex subunit 6 [Venturia nashicola]